MARVGYARVSSVGQSLAVQLEKLRHCDKIYQEKKSIHTLMRDFHVSKATVYRYLDGVRPDHVNTASHQSQA